MAPQKVVNHNYSLRSVPTGGFKDFESFYPYYLGEHCNKINRRLHLFGTGNTFLITAYALSVKKFQILPLVVVQAYFWAWIGHFFFERNKPATFKYPVWSLMGDFKMFIEVMTLQRKA